ncbi:hypothetical protein CRYUN_Cryun17cG0147000 [Craigia yunnanensis]
MEVVPGNDEIMARGTFANIRIVNKLLKGEVGPKTIHIPTGEKLSVYDVAMGVKAVIAESFERIHRGNLVGMGIIPLCFKAGEDDETLGLTGYERYTIGLPSSVSEIRPGQDITVATDSGKSFTCTARFDTEVIKQFSHFLPSLIRLFSQELQSLNFLHTEALVSEMQVELAYFNHGGILQCHRELDRFETVI